MIRQKKSIITEPEFRALVSQFVTERDWNESSFQEWYKHNISHMEITDVTSPLCAHLARSVAEDMIFSY